MEGEVGIHTNWLLRVAGCGTLCFAVLATLPRADAQQNEPVVQPSGAVAAELPDSPGAASSKAQPSLQRPANGTQLLAAQTSTGAIRDPQPEAAPSQSETLQENQPAAQKPVGTAAAGAIPTSGIAASQPAGVAVAPAKQHRVRTIILRTGAIVGAGIAIGAVVALTEATPSKPPGAH
jgi:hypothetical protein